MFVISYSKSSVTDADFSASKFTPLRGAKLCYDAVADPEAMRMGGCIPTGTHSAPKLAILRSKMEKKFLGSTTSPTNDFWIRHCYDGT